MNDELIDNYSQDIRFTVGIAGCVDSETQYLTRTGWKYIPEFNGEDIAIIDKEFNMKFEKPLGYIVKPDKQEVYHIFDETNRSNINMVLTDEHRVPCVSLKGKFYTMSCKDYLNDLAPLTRGKRVVKKKIPVSIKYFSEQDIPLSDYEIKLLLAIQADGSLLNRAVRFNFKRQDKIEELLHILDTLEVSYHCNRNGANGYTQISFSRQYERLMTKDLSILWGVSIRQALLVTKNIVKWDGALDSRTGNPRFFTTDKKNADIVQYIFTIATNKQVSISTQDRRDKENGSNYCIEYTVNTTTLTKREVNTNMIHKKQVQAVYCFTTSTSYWVARRGDFIFMTGNTGKSYRLVEEYKTHKNAIVLTPTHKAKEVLQARGLTNTITIHSLLKLVPTIDMNFRKRGKLQRLQRIGDVDLKSVSVVIIDEYSMIPTHILDLLLDLLPAKAKVSIYGDSMQLSPVDGDPIDPYWYTSEDKVTTLTTQYRSDAPEVVETFTRFVEFLKSPRADADLRLNPTIERFRSIKEAMKVHPFSPNTDRALAYTNAKAIEINNQIAEHLGLPKEISVGESIYINGILGTLISKPTNKPLTIYPSCIVKGKLDINNLEDKVSKIESDMAKYNQRPIDGVKYYISIEGEPYAFYADIDHYVHSKEYKAEVEDSQLELIREYSLDKDINLKEFCNQNRSLPLVRARGRAWSNYLAHLNLVFDIRRPFCTTVHKSQGSEFSTIYLAQDDIKKAIRGNYYEQYARLMYVGLSRAIKKVVVI